MPETDATSTDFASTSLARAAEVPVPQADALAGRFPLTANPSPLAEDERAAVLRSLHFGNAFTDHMAHARWRQGEGWGDYGVIPYGSLSLSPAAAVVDYYVIASPAGSYFPHGLEPVSIWVTTEYHRAGRGGTGAAKTGGNYASSLLPQQEAYAQGCDQVCFLDDVSQKNIEELGGMNLMVVDADGTVRTPRLTGTILEGCTRSAIIRLLRDSGRNVVEETISLQGLLADIESGRVSEVFACGTAAVVVPLGRLKGEGFDARIEGSEVTRQIHDRLTAIQSGRAEDPYGWMYQLVPPRS